jgi:U3 small nucleolar RNA-associated protein 4
MASGDGAGGVQLWDAALGTRLAAFHAHAADVLALAAAPDGSALFAAGIDPQLAVFQRVPGQKGGSRQCHGPCMHLAVRLACRLRLGRAALTHRAC